MLTSRGCAALKHCLGSFDTANSREQNSFKILLVTFARKLGCFARKTGSRSRSFQFSVGATTRVTEFEFGKSLMLLGQFQPTPIRYGCFMIKQSLIDNAWPQQPRSTLNFAATGPDDGPAVELARACVGLAGDWHPAKVLTRIRPVGRTTLFRLAREGKIRVCRIKPRGNIRAGKTLFSLSSLDAFFHEHECHVDTENVGGAS